MTQDRSSLYGQWQNGAFISGTLNLAQKATRKLLSATLHTSLPDVFSQLSQNLPGEMLEGTIVIVQDLQPKLSLRVEGRCRDSKSPLWNFSFQYDPAEQNLRIGRVNSARQRQGTGRLMMKNILAFARPHNVQTMALFAQDMGGYFWTKLGFLPDSENWPYVRGLIAERAHAFCLPDKTQRILQEVTHRSSKPETIRKILALEAEVLIAGGRLPLAVHLLRDINCDAGLDLKDRTSRRLCFDYAGYNPAAQLRMGVLPYGPRRIVREPS